MLFNSLPFILLFLPGTALGFFLVGARSRRLGALWLGGASLVFYSWWHTPDLGVLAGSAAFNFLVARWLATAGAAPNRRKAALIAALAIDLGLLAYFKYTNFLLGSLAAALGRTLPPLAIVLPLGISFFTFTQIAFLLDCYRGKAREPNPIRYLLFVTFFPHLIAGPVLHHAEMMPQFARPDIYRPRLRNIAAGLSIFLVGLFKKVGLADSVALLASPVFEAAQAGKALGFLDGWGGALAYTLQIYFDFSGYSDMAVGLSLIFNIRLPINFRSPYKADSIIEFWRRWHITLSRFLRDYLYVPLGGNRKGPARRHVNLMITMLLGGLWHGAGWTFVVWGGLHGLYLAVNHAWRAVRGGRRPRTGLGAATAVWSGRILTFLAVVVAWVFFRAPSLGAAVAMLEAMAAPSGAPSRVGLDWTLGGAFLVVLMGICWFLPNTMEVFRHYRPALDAAAAPASGRPRALRWRPTLAWGSALALAAAFALAKMLATGYSEFLYFQF